MDSETTQRRSQLLVASSYGRAGASARVRVLDWIDFLGIEAEVEDYLGLADTRPSTLLRHPLATSRAEFRLRRRRSDRAHTVLISRSVSPLSRGGLETKLLRRSRWGVYDFDDALWVDRRGGIHAIFDRRESWRRCVTVADQVIAGNDYLAEAASRLSPNVTVIPSCVNPDDYRQKQQYQLNNPPRILWLGSPSTEPYLQDIADALLTVHRETGARLTLISSGDRPLGSLRSMTDRVPWAGAITNGRVRDADCGIMPLPDTPFTRGKCAYKLLQYGAAALPVVGSPVGVNERVVNEMRGMAATTPGQWADAILSMLRETRESRQRRGSAARDTVERSYSYSAWRIPFLQALRLSADHMTP